jgi:hypothetical protein
MIRRSLFRIDSVIWLVTCLKTMVLGHYTILGYCKCSVSIAVAG